MLMVFRLNGRLLEQGDQLVEPFNLTSARWQVLGAAALAGKPLSAPQIAEAMGITRQGAQKQLNKLEEDGFFEQSINPRHQRSPLYVLTELGNRTFAKAMALEAVWANGLVMDLPLLDLKNTLQTLITVYERLDSPVPKKATQA
ncbi:MAG: winged helix-turn-helix transcriptional regulator [Glaciimonas sp.]|nr:winged helix-turn-helix transcriptional regulator [Glaciimonas sp.]